MTETEKKKKPPLVIIAGPTAVGKSAAAVSLAEKIGGEIISADSMQVYRGMDIGTAKVTEAEKHGIPHHLIDVMDPHEDYHVVNFQKMAKAAAEEIYSRGKIPILCGGTGFYIQALLYDIEFAGEPVEEAEKRKYFEALLMEAKQADEQGESGAALLHERLAAVDPEAASEIPAANRKRVTRALEFYELYGKKISEHNREQARRKESSAYNFRFFVLTDERERLYRRIDARVDRMFEAGLLQEVEALLKQGVSPSSTAMQGIGYKEVLGVLSGACTEAEARELIKRNSRHYAKRQLTWFRRENAVIWIDIGRTPDVLSELLRHIPAEWTAAFVSPKGNKKNRLYHTVFSNEKN